MTEAKRGQKKPETHRQRYYITEKMPAWMRQFLAFEGIEREFTIPELNSDQMSAIDFACHLKEMQKHGLIEIIYDPKTCPDPMIAPTEKGLRIYGRKP